VNYKILLFSDMTVCVRYVN